MRETPEALFQFSIKSLYDLLPTPQNKNKWFRTDQYSCHLCSGSGTLEHILSGCKVALSQGRYSWRHDRVLRELSFWIDEKRKVINNSPWKRRAEIKFVKPGEKSKPASPVTPQSFLKIARDWKIQVDLPGSRVTIPIDIAVTAQRPDIVISSEAVKQLFLIELTVPIEGRSEISSELKAAKYEQGIAEAALMKGWKTSIYPVEVGCRGYPASTMSRLIGDIGYSGRQRRSILAKLGRTAEECSMQIWKCSQYRQWGEKA